MSKVCLVLVLLGGILFGCKDRMSQQIDSTLKNGRAFPGFQAYFNKHGITKEYSIEGVRNLVAFVHQHKEEVEKGMADGEIKGSTGRQSLAFLEVARDMAQISLNEEATHKEKVYGYIMAQRILYTLLSEDEDINRIAAIQKINKQLAMLRNFAFKFLQLKIPFRNEKERMKKLSLAQARKESKFLTNPENPREFLSPEDLTKLNHWEVADLDIGEHHPIWHTKKFMNGKKNRWESIEDWMENAMTLALKQDRSTFRNDPNFRYSLPKMRKVLFFKKVKTTATSPKINTVDAYNMKWKLKWGDETQTEIVANRLWMEMGGKYNDLVYVNGAGGDFVTLILNEAPENEQEMMTENVNNNDTRVQLKRKCVPVTPDDLVYCMLHSAYNFNLKHYIYEKGQITEENQDEILRHLPAHPKKKFKKSNLIGRYYVTFRESLVEFKPDSRYVARGGSTAFSAIGALDDRVARGLFLFNMWINNRDAKDDNNRGIILKNFNGKPGNTYVEMQHDLGVTFGGLSTSGAVNRMPTGSWFLKEPTIGNNMHFHQFLLYLPAAWRQITYADALWMAKKIASFTRKDLEGVVSHSLWPDFMQEVLVHRLLKRRNQIAKVFRIKHLLDEQKVEPLNISIFLGSDEARAAVAKKYFNLPKELIDEAMKKARLGDQYHDRLVVDGKVNDCNKTILIGILQRERFPTGLSYRVSRMSDYKERDRGCNFGRLDWEGWKQKQLRVFD